jgi:hypothetical protein
MQQLFPCLPGADLSYLRFYLFFLGNFKHQQKKTKKYVSVENLRDRPARLGLPETGTIAKVIVRSWRSSTAICFKFVIFIFKYF